MFLSKEEKVLVLLFRVEKERAYALFGKYGNYSVGENKIRKLHNRISKLGGNIQAKVSVETQ